MCDYFCCLHMRAKPHQGCVHVLLLPAAPPGSASSIRTALALTRPMGTLVLKTTVSLNDPTMPGWSELANDIVVNEKTLVGSRWVVPCSTASAWANAWGAWPVRQAVTLHKVQPLIHQLPL